MLIGPPPASGHIIDVAASIGLIDAEWLRLRLADERGIGVAAAQVREAADARIDLAKLIGPFPGDGERADRTRAGAADRPHLRIGRNAIALFHFRKNLLQQEAGVPIP